MEQTETDTPITEVVVEEVKPRMKFVLCYHCTKEGGIINRAFFHTSTLQWLNDSWAPSVSGVATSSFKGRCNTVVRT
jgi:hypothetical protein